jgi:hypothetical protein
VPQRALRAAVEVAERAGLHFDRPVVLRDGRNLRDAFVEARRLQVTVWTLVFAGRHPDAREPAAARLAGYRARESG